MPLAILKPSFWRSRREVRDASNALVGEYRLRGVWMTKAEAESLGRKFSFGYTGWDMRYSRMTDASGNVIATMAPADWWGMRYKLSYNGKEYLWKLNGWGTVFTIFDGEREIARVHPGGYFWPGRVAVQNHMENKDLVPLILFGIYQLYMISSQAAAASGGGGGAT